MSTHLSSKRARARETAAQRQSEKREWRGNLLDLIAAGHPYDEVAAVLALLPHIERYWRLRHALHAASAQVLTPSALKSFGAEPEFPPHAAAPLHP